MYALLTLSLFVAANETKDTADIQGTWVIVSAVRNGESHDKIKGDKMTLKDDTVTVKRKNKDEKASYKIDPSQKPKAIDITPDGDPKSLHGIYTLEGDKLTICLSREPGQKRPTEFSAKEGSDQMLI